MLKSVERQCYRTVFLDFMYSTVLDSSQAGAAAFAPRPGARAGQTQNRQINSKSLGHARAMPRGPAPSCHVRAPFLKVRHASPSML